MPGTDLVIDPSSRDLVDDGHGDWLETRTLQPQLYHALHVRRGEWFAKPDAGCDAHAIPRKASHATLLRFKDAYEAALRPFVDEGLAEDLAVQVTRDGRQRFAIEASLRDVQHGDIDLTPLLPFGGTSEG